MAQPMKYWPRKEGQTDEDYVFSNLSTCVKLLDGLASRRIRISANVRALREGRQCAGSCVDCGDPLNRDGALCLECLKKRAKKIINENGGL